MCGIAGIYVKDPKALEKPKAKEQMEAMLDQLLLGIESRGTDATGFVAASANKTMEIDKAPIAASSFIKVRKKLPKDTRVILGHTRLATKGDPSNFMNNHPVIYEGMMVIHNGIITNDDSIFKDEDFKRYAQVDTEAIAAMLRKTGLENPGEGLGKLRGLFSCAAFDVANPLELLLFKHGSNPLVYHENKQFLVWASTPKAIKEAWGNVLGTPPAWAKFEHLKDNSILRIKDGVVDITDDAIKSTFQGTQSNTWSDWNQEDWDSWDVDECRTPIYLERSNTDYSQTPDKFTSVSSVGEIFGKRRPIINKNKKPSEILEDCRRTVIAKRDRISITFDDRVKLTAEQLVEIKGKGNKPEWDHCKVCKTTVARVHTVEHKEQGNICLDCNLFLTAGTLKEYEYPGKKDTVYSDIETIDQIEEWAQLEAYIHYNTMQRVEDYTGMSMHAIDYLLHRATPEYLEPAEVNKLYKDLKFRYEEENGVVWELYSRQYEKEHPREEEEKTEENGWISCASGVHKSDEDCDACRDIVDAEFTILTEPTVVGDKPRTYGEGSAQKLKGYKDRMSAHTKMWKPGDPIVGREKPDGKCLLCPTNAKFLTTKHYRWCNKHYSYCGILADSGEDCSNDPTGWDENGVRRCHFHSRGVKNFMTPKMMREINERAKSKV